MKSMAKVIEILDDFSSRINTSMSDRLRFDRTLSHS